MFPILIVEDEPHVRLSVRSALMGHGLDPVVCRTPRDPEALRQEVAARVRSWPPLGAVIDLGLPEPERGEAVLEQVRGLAGDIPVALLAESGALPRARRAARACGATLVEKGPAMAGELLAALEGCWARSTGLEARIQSYLQTLSDACELWGRLRGAPQSDVLRLLEEERAGLNRDHRQSLAPVARALESPSWPPRPADLASLRALVLGVVDRLGPDQERLAHVLSHQVANNFILGVQFVQGVVHGHREAGRLLEAARAGRPAVRADRVALLGEVVAAFAETEGAPDHDRVLRLQRLFSEYRLEHGARPPAADAHTVHGIRRILLVENDETMYRLFQSMLTDLAPGVRLLGCGGSREAREILDRERDPGSLLVLLDLSVPRAAGRSEEHFDFGLEVLAAAREQGVRVVVTSGISEIPTAIRRALDLNPVAFLPKTEPAAMREALREILERLPARAAPDGEPVYVLRNRGRQVQYRAEVVDVGEAAVSLMRVLAERRTATLPLDEVHDHSEVVRHFWRKRRARDPGAEKDYAKSVRDAVSKANSAVSRALQARGWQPSDLLAVDRSCVRALVPLVVVPPESLRAEGDLDLEAPLEPSSRYPEPPRPLRVLVVDPLPGYAACLERWIRQDFPVWGRAEGGVAVAGTLQEAAAALPGADIVVLELQTLTRSRPSPKSARPDVAEALDWMRGVSGAGAGPEFVVLTASSDPLHEVQALSACPGLRHYLRKGGDRETRARLCLALADLYQRRFGFVREKPRAGAPLFRVQVTPQGPVLLDGVSICFEHEDSPSATRWAAPLVLRILALHPGVPVGADRLLQEVREHAEAEIAEGAADRSDEEARLLHPLYGGGRPKRRAVENEDDPDELSDSFVSRVIEECRSAIMLSLAAEGRHLGFRDSISLVGQRTYLLNGVRIAAGEGRSG